MRPLNLLLSVLAVIGAVAWLHDFFEDPRETEYTER